MQLNKEMLINYGNLKAMIEERADIVMKEYYKFNGWNFPTDYSINHIDVYDGKVDISYYGFMNNDNIVVPIKYFLTLNEELLGGKENE